MANFIINPGQVVKKVLITKDESEEDEHLELSCEIVFDNGDVITYIIEPEWDVEAKEYLYCDLESDDYPRGLYEVKNEKFIQIENWDD